jgi:anthranilate phosphoribosyltransferase
MSANPHPFAQFVAILGRGPTRSRNLTLEEAEQAMEMILSEQVEPEQLGAFLMLLRRNVETDEEIAGFVNACQKHIQLPQHMPKVDLDWSSYSGKRRQLPYFILSALALAESGVNILMQGAEEHTAGRMYTSAVLELMGIKAADSLAHAADDIQACGFAYIRLGEFYPVLQHLLGFKAILGLRSPVHTFGRMINPFQAPHSIQGIFHPNYMPIHQGAAYLVKQPHMAVLRGEGGEVEVRPNKPFDVCTVHNGVKDVEKWSRILPETRQPTDEEMDPNRLLAIWSGEYQDDYADAAIQGTMAVVLKLMNKADNETDAMTLAKTLWQKRLAGQRIHINLP